MPRGDEQCVRLGAVRHVIHHLAALRSVRVARIESAGAHVERAHHIIIHVREEQLVRCCPAGQSQNTRALSFERLSVSRS